MLIPTPERQVAVQPVQEDRPQIQPITPSASGANIGEAVSGLGQTVEKSAGEVAQAWETGARLASETRAFGEVVDFSSQHASAMHSVDPSTGQIATDANGKPIGILDRQGKDAVGAVDEYRAKMTKLMQDKMKGMNPYEQQVFGHYARFTIQGGIQTANGHEAEQVQRYRAKTVDDFIHSRGQDALINMPMKDPKGSADYLYRAMTDAQSAAIQHIAAQGLHGAPILDASGNQITDERGNKLTDTTEAKQQAADHVAVIALEPHIEAAPQLALHLIDDPRIAGELSPTMLTKLQQAIHGKMMDVEANTLMADAGIKHNSDGSPNLDDVQNKARSLTEYTQDEQDKILHLYEIKNNARVQIITNTNKAQSIAFMSQVSALDKDGTPRMLLEDANKLAIKMASKLQNGQVDNDDVRDKFKYIAAVHAPPKGNLDPEVYVNLRAQVDNGSIRGSGPIIEAHDAGLISTSAMNTLMWKQGHGDTDVMQSTWDDLKKTLPDSKIAKIDDQEFEATAHLAWVDKTRKNPQLSNDPQALREFWQKSLDSAPTGIHSIWAKVNAPWNTMQEKPYWEQEKEAQKMGSGNTEDVVATMQRLGIASRDSDQGNALAALMKKGWKPESITPQIIQTTIDAKNKAGK